MPRNYQRKTVTKYNVEDLKRAIEDVKSKKLTLGKASTVYSVPKTTIFDHMKKMVIKQPRCGRKSVFSDLQELELENHIINCSKLFYGLTINMVRKIAFRFAEENKLPHSFNQTKKMAGKDWYRGFMQRHPRISLRKPEATSLNRINSFNAPEVQLFYNNLIELQNKHNFQPDKIFNVDETGITNVQRNAKILAPKGQKQIGHATSGERGSTTTVVCAFSAAGQYIPPFFIFKRKRMNAQLLKGGNANMVAAVSDSGWINESLFVEWLHHFISYAKPTKDDPILLVLDNHDSHISLDVYTLCRDKGIVLLTLPPHTSHRLQPLDLTFYGPIKTAYNRECQYYMAEHPGRAITQYDVVELFTRAFNRCSNLEKAASGFRAAGIYPLHPIEFEDTQTPPAQNFVVHVPDPQASEAQVLVPALEPPVFVPANDIQAPAPVLDVLDHRAETPEKHVAIALSDIVNLPIITPKTTKRNIKKKHSVILTSTPVKDELQLKYNIKIAKQKKEVDQKQKIKNTLKRLKTEKGEEAKQKKKTAKKLETNKKAVINFKNVKEFCLDNENIKKRRTPKSAKENIEYFCIFCHEKYGDSPHGEDWIQCYVCKNWAHEKCTDGQSSSYGYRCDLCRTN